MSTRGSSETVLCAIILAALYLFKQHRVIPASILFGLSVHMKIYPIIYALPLLLYLPTHRLRLTFFIVSASTFWVLGGIMYKLYGIDFITETFTYHITRQDHRHNFSIYAYQIYLHYTESIAAFVKILVFLPQFVLVGVMGTTRGGLELRMFCQTFAFVMLNKVITSQV
jgi:phosphatidylinositol glycan class M